MSADLEEVDAGRRAEIGIDLIRRDERRWAVSNRRPRALTAREAFTAMQFEALLVWTAAHSLTEGLELSEIDLDRLTTACKRIDAICLEMTR